MLRTLSLAAFALLLSLLLAYSALNTPTKISPQGCRMSYMSPSYVLQPAFNASWTSASLAARYRLMLYREVGWDPDDELRGVPVLFIPGNAGSAHQVRSIASSASRQYYSSPGHIDSSFSSRNIKQLDVFAVDFNEDLSAFHGPTLASQRQYSAAAVSYILSLYPPNTQLILMGHSMGGIVAASLLPSPHISALLTMSTPHGAPPARFDARMDSIYADVQARLAHDPTPVLSVCGGVTDTMIPSEFCALPPSSGSGLDGAGFRKTVFTSSLEGCWSGVGHREMVWCHQVRWRVARAALEIGGTHTREDVASALSTWFRDGLDGTNYEIEDSEPDISEARGTLHLATEGAPLIIRNPRGTQSYKLPIPTPDTRYGSDTPHLVLYLSEGTVLSLSPANPLSLKASVQICRQVSSIDSDSVELPPPECKTIHPSSLRLIPNPEPSKPFPVPSEGVDESDGVVALTAPILPHVDGSVKRWVSLQVQSETTKGWVVAAVEREQQVMSDASVIAPLFSGIELKIDPKALQTSIWLPRLLSNVLLVYQVQPKLSGSCGASLLPPLLLHTSGPSEAHFYRLSETDLILLHGHSSAPFLPIPKELTTTYSRGLNLTVYSSGECGVEAFTISVDWWNSFGRWGARYWNAVLAWSAGVVCFISYSSWAAWDAGAPMPTPFQSFKSLARVIPRAMVLFTLISLAPLPKALWLGNAGEPLFAPVAPFILLIASGLVITSWIMLLAILMPYGKLISLVSRPEEEDSSKEQPISYRGGLFTIIFMSLLVFLLIPWQVAFLACYLIHLHHCATLLNAPTRDQAVSSARNQKMLVLLAMTWCLPVVAPVLTVWVRTLATAGLTTPFDGDHFVLNSISFVALTYAMVTTRGPLFLWKHKRELISVPHVYLLGALVAFLVGPRSTFRMYEALNWPTLALLVFRVAPRYLHG